MPRRSLVNHCYDLRFARPQKATIAKRVRVIAKMEGMDVDDNAAEMLVEANGNDIRQARHRRKRFLLKTVKKKEKKYYIYMFVFCLSIVKNHFFRIYTVRKENKEKTGRVCKRVR